MAFDARIRLDSRTGAAEIDAIEEACRAAGVSATVEASRVQPPHTGNGVSVMVEVLVNTSIGAFLTAYFGAFGLAAAKATKSWVERVATARSASATHMVSVPIKGPGDTTVSLRPGLPDEAYQGLHELLAGDVEGGSWTWDEDDRAWRDLRAAEPVIDARPGLVERVRGMLGRRRTR